MLSQRGALVYHSMGSGKTITSLSCGYALLDRGLIDNVVVLAPKSVQDYWRDNATSLGMASTTRIFTHNVFDEDAVTSRTLLIVDEAHNFRTEIVDNPGRQLQSQKAYRLMRVACLASKVLLLSGTPIVNKEDDLKNLVYAIIKQQPFDYRDYARFQSSSALAKPYTDAYRDVGDERMPSTSYNRVEFTMTPAFLKWYETVEENVTNSLMVNTKNLKMFLNGVRRAVNGVQWSGTDERSSPKIAWLREQVATWRGRGEKVLIYSAWKDFGMRIVEDALKDCCPGLSIRIIDGNVSSSKRGATVSDFNADKLDVIMVTAAGSEGINLLGTRHVVILEPHWNEARVSQAVHRARRINSHAHLPQDRRNVTVYKLVMKKPGLFTSARRRFESADTILENKTGEKKALGNAFFAMVQPSTMVQPSV